MSDEYVAIYLNDHLAGSVAALELLTHLEEAHAATPGPHFFVDLRVDIEADRRELEALMGRLQIAVSPMRKATAWFAEKAAQLKLRLDDPAGGALSRLQALVLCHSLIVGLPRSANCGCLAGSCSLEPDN